jgi:hypothetical protein
MKWAESGYRKSQRSEKGITLRAATSKGRCTPLRDTHKNGGFCVRVGLWEAREGRNRRRRCAAVPFDAANGPHELLGKVVCRAPPPIFALVVVPGFLAQSTQLEPEAVSEANM